MNKSLILTFWALVGVFLVILGEFFVPIVGELLRGPFLFLLPFIIFSLLGIALVFLTVKEKVKGKLKIFLILTGVSAAGFFIGVFLHNAFYALGTIISHIAALSFLTEVLHVFFFLIAIFVCPLGFLVGAVSSIVFFIKNRTRF